MDPLGTKAISGGDRGVAAVSRLAPATAATPVATPADTPPPAPQAAQLASELSASPPIDMDRVSRIKKAIADGTFPIYPATIADRLIALKYDWTPHDHAS